MRERSGARPAAAATWWPFFAAILCTGGLDVIRKEAFLSAEPVPVSAYAGSLKNLRLCWELEESEALEGRLCDCTRPSLQGSEK